MDSLVQKSDPGMEQYMDLLLYGRNRRWVANMPNIMGPRTTLFAVGAEHLGGEQGVINLLKKEGIYGDAIEELTKQLLIHQKKKKKKKKKRRRDRHTSLRLLLLLMRNIFCRTAPVH